MRHLLHLNSILLIFYLLLVSSLQLCLRISNDVNFSLIYHHSHLFFLQSIDFIPAKYVVIIFSQVVFIKD